MKEDVLNKAVKIARIIDDSVERDAALSNIAQVQAAMNCPEDALDTIANIRYDDIRADALRKSLDNLQTRFYLKKEAVPQLNVWLERLMEETMSIPDINVRCPKLHAINLLILSRMDDKELVYTYLRQSQSEFIRLENSSKSFKYLFAEYQLYKQLDDEAEALDLLNRIQKRIEGVKPIVQQGLMRGLIAYELWIVKGKNVALEYIQSTEDQTAKSFAYLQLVELLAVGGNLEDAQQIAAFINEEEQKSFSERFIDMGKSLIHSMLEMKGAVLNLNKSLYFRERNKKKDSDFSFQEERPYLPTPIWFSLSVSIVPKKDEKNSDDSESDNIKDDQCLDEDGVVDEEQTTASDNQEINWDEYDWDGYDWDGVKKNNKELDRLFRNNDSEDDEDDEELWTPSSDDDDDDAESWMPPSDDDDDDDDADNKPRKGLNFAGKIEILVRNESFLNDVPKDRYFSMTEALHGIVSFNRTLPPRLYQHFIRRLNIFFPIIEKDNYRASPQRKEKVEEFIARQEEFGFDAALQEVISQGDYSFAVECSLNYYCFQNKENLIFGYNTVPPRD